MGRRGGGGGGGGVGAGGCMSVQECADGADKNIPDVAGGVKLRPDQSHSLGKSACTSFRQTGRACTETSCQKRMHELQADWQSLHRDKLSHNYSESAALIAKVLHATM